MSRTPGRVVRVRGHVLRTAVAVVATVGVATGSATPAAADPKVAIGVGHIDIGARIVDGRWRVQIRDDTVDPETWREARDVVLVARDTAMVSVPANPAFGFLGAPGTPLWLLPQVEKPGVLWPGWNTQHPSVLATITGPVTWSLTGVDGPGALSLFLTDGFGNPQILFSSARPFPQHVAIEPNTHAHGSWTFGAPGVYRLRLAMAARASSGQVVSDEQIVSFAVGDGTDPAMALLPDDPSRPPPGPPGPVSPGPSPGGPAFDPGAAPPAPPDAITPGTDPTATESVATAVPGQDTGAGVRGAGTDDAASNGPDTAAAGESGVPLAAVVASLLALAAVAGAAVAVVRRRRQNPDLAPGNEGGERDGGEQDGLGGMHAGDGSAAGPTAASGAGSAGKQEAGEEDAGEEEAGGDEVGDDPAGGEEASGG